MIVYNEFLNDSRVLKEAETLQNEGYKVIVLALHTPGITKKKETLHSGINVLRVNRSFFWKLRKQKSTIQQSKHDIVSSTSYITKLKIFVKIISRLWTHLILLFNLIKTRPDIIHSHDVNTLLTAYVASKIIRAHLIYDAHEISTSREGYSNFRTVVAYIEKFICHRVRGVITTTNMRAKYLARAYKIDRPLSLYNMPKFNDPKKSNLIRDKLNLVNKWPIIIYQGGLQQGRGLENLILAFAQLKTKAYLVFVGDGRLEGTLRDIRNKNALTEKVFFTGKIALSELPNYTASADIGIQPIENTCFNHFSTDSNKIFEYIMAGLPCIASDLPEIRKIVHSSNIGCLFTPGVVDELREVMEKLINDPNLRLQYSKNSIKASKNYSWETQEKKFLDFYRQSISTNKK